MSAATSALQNLTLGEVAAIESLSGQSIAAMADGNAPIGKTMAAMAYVIKRRANLDYKFEEALKLTLAEANDVLGMVEADPTE